MDRITTSFLASIVLLSPALAADWPQQMGPNRDGVVNGEDLATEWKDGKLPVLWQTKLSPLPTRLFIETVLAQLLNVNRPAVGEMEWLPGRRLP